MASILKSMKLLRYVAVWLTVGCLTVQLWAGTNEGRAAYDRGDYRVAFSEFRTLADKGDIEAQTMVGWMLSQGLGVPKDFQAGRSWLERAAAAGHDPASAKAQHDLGVIYENAIGVSKDMKKAFSWYLQAAENGDTSAQTNVGTLYIDGNGIKRDATKGVYWLTKAAKQGDPEAYANLGMVYFEGLGTAKNWPLSYFFLFMTVNHSGREVPNARNNLNIVTKKLSPTQLAEGRKLVQEALAEPK